MTELCGPLEPPEPQPIDFIAPLPPDGAIARLRCYTRSIWPGCEAFVSARACWLSPRGGRRLRSGAIAPLGAGRRRGWAPDARRRCLCLIRQQRRGILQLHRLRTLRAARPATGSHRLAED